MQANEEEYLTVQETALLLGISDGAVRIACMENRLPSTKKYGRKVIAEGDVQAYRERTRPDGVKPIGRPKGSRTKQSATDT